ncbi:MAG: Monosaccharide-transporting ATPase [Conexibacter sp.]|nr:Monosaccharide-transporting ATPase [Conexibacter sp.]
MPDQTQERPRERAAVPPALAGRSLSKGFAGVLALDAVDLTIEAGEVHALLGENGSGKSTLIKLLSGYHRAEGSTEVHVGGASMTLGSPRSSHALGCRFVHQDLGLVDAATIADNLCLGAGFPLRWGTIRARELRRRARGDLARVGVELDPARLVGELTPAMKTGIAVARALASHGGDPVKLLVLDEPTATLPDDEVNDLLGIVERVAASGVGVLYVTHRIDEVFRIADNVTVLRDGRKVTTRPTASLDRRELINLLVGSEFDETQAASEALAPSAADALLHVETLDAGPVRAASFEVAAGEVVGIAGITGSGRETILGALFGANPREAGTVLVGEQPVPAARPAAAMEVGVAYLPPDRPKLGALMELSARENLSLADLRPFWRRMRLQRRAEASETRAWFDRLSIRPLDGSERRLATFSGGNQQKLLFAKWLRRRPRVFLLDEPTQGVDIAAKRELHRQLLLAAADGAAVVVSSSDIDELAVLCHRVLVLRDGRIVANLTGDRVSVDRIARECLNASGKVIAA